MSRGLSNGEIADNLIVGDNTIKTHVGHILDKLDARDRVQAVIIAYQAGLADVKVQQSTRTQAPSYDLAGGHPIPVQLPESGRSKD